MQTDTATGTVRFDGQGVAYGRVTGKGTIKVKGTSFSVGHWSSRKKASTGWWTYSGQNMSLSVSSSVHLRITGGGIDVRVVADGTGYRQGHEGPLPAELHRLAGDAVRRPQLQPVAGSGLPRPGAVFL